MAETQVGATRKKNGTALAYVLVFVFALFIGILVVVYVITKQSHPVILDEHGKPIASLRLSPGIGSGSSFMV